MAAVTSQPALENSLRDADSLPTMAGSWPLVGHFPRSYRSGLRMMIEAKATLGPWFWIEFPIRQRILICSDLSGLAMFRDPKFDTSHLGRDFRLFFGDSMLTLSGKAHRRARNASAPSFSPGGLQRTGVARMVHEVVHRAIEGWPEGAPLMARQMTNTIALEVIFRLVGMQADEELDAWTRAYRHYSLSAVPIPINLPGLPQWYGLRGRQWLESNFRRIIGEVRRQGTRDSLVASMVHGWDASDTNDTDGDGALIDDLILLLGAGHETSAALMAWVVLYLAHDPKSFARVLEEALASPQWPENPEAVLEAFPFATGVFRETLRLRSPVTTISRYAAEATDIAGIQVPQGTMVGMSVRSISFDPERYPEPEQWRPERWSGVSPKPQAVENLYFGSGAHFCLGYHLASLEIVTFIVCLAKILHERGLKLVYEGKLPGEVTVPFLRPTQKVPIYLRPA